MQTNKELIIETLKEQGWKKFYLGSPFEDGLEEDYSDVADKILFMLTQFGSGLKPQLQQTPRSTLLPSVQEMIDGIEAEKVKYPRMWTDDVLRLLNRVKELAAIA
jgi:hypothetical protein